MSKFNMEVIKITIRESLYFSYAGIQSDFYGIVNVNMSSGMQEEVFAASRSINEVSIKGRDKPYFQSTKKEPLKFNVSFAFEDKWDDVKIREVAIWLTEQSYYQPLFFSEDPEKIYYALCVDDINLVHNCLRQGYITLAFRCDAPYAYSSIYNPPVYKWRYQPFDVQVNDTNGDKHKVIIENGKLTLNPNKTMWTEFRGKKWYEISN
ncbi:MULTISPECIES: distal tail protein Dit [Paenibacillus]|uniref:Phage tail protein n=2 Tax=Paenibacillus TaxID=44249 RepID=A0ABX2Z9Z0_PAEPO|nr:MULTISPECIES: distal tail protein Dit [Paenibacillus]MDR6779319.1 putative phage tail component-like protein [Paenibacillus peoriae]ODA08123.1 phage tail protein [Paenibacillus polymyxa]